MRKEESDDFVGCFEWLTKLSFLVLDAYPQNMVPGLYDPLGFSKNRSEEAKARGRASEIKNGRLAMIGVAGMYFAATIPGSVPLQPDC